MALSGTGRINKAQARRDTEKKIRRNLHSWFKRHGRALPWRQTSDPYAIMVSEFMLQQTTVTAVIPYFQRWMARFPTLDALARAAERDVLAVWQGLGYYSRARNLHRAAIAIVEQGEGTVPRSVDALRRLAGVGEYTAAAIASFAFDAAEPVIDANIARVLVRLWNWPKPVDNAAGRVFLRDAAHQLLPGKGGCLHNSALMDLGALICVPRTPRCLECPIRSHCSAQQPGSLPVRRPRKSLVEISEARAFVFEKGKLWLEPSQGSRWHGLWVLPKAESAKSFRADHEEVYTITRFRVTLRVFAESRKLRPLTGYIPGGLPPMPSPHRRAVAAMLPSVHNGK